jgi:hypothetical protein
MAIPKLPSQSITLILICGGAILAFIILAIYPNYISLADMDMEIKSLNARLEEQKVLFPVFKDIFKKAQISNKMDLPFTNKEKLSREDTEIIPIIIKKATQQGNIKLESIVTDVESAIGDSAHLRIDISLKGGFLDLRKFLLKLNKLPYLEHIEKIRIQSEKKSHELQCDLKIWMAQE